MMDPRDLELSPWFHPMFYHLHIIHNDDCNLSVLIVVSVSQSGHQVAAHPEDFSPGSAALWW